MLYSLHFQHKQRAQCSAQSPALVGGVAGAGEGKGSSAPAPLPRAAVLPATLTSHTPWATAALPITQHSLRGMRSESSGGSTVDGGVKPLSFHGERRRAAPASLLQLEHGHGDAFTHANAQGMSRLPSRFLPVQLLTPRGAERMPLVRAAVSGLLAAAGQGRRPLRQI